LYFKLLVFLNFFGQHLYLHFLRFQRTLLVFGEELRNLWLPTNFFVDGSSEE